LFYDIGCTTASSLESNVAMSLIHVINIVLVLHSLSIVLILEYLSKYTLSTRGHARMITSAISATILYAHSSSVYSIELILHASASG